MREGRSIWQTGTQTYRKSWDGSNRALKSKAGSKTAQQHYAEFNRRRDEYYFWTKARFLPLGWWLNIHAPSSLSVKEAVFASRSLSIGRTGDKAAVVSPCEAVAVLTAASFAHVQDQFARNVSRWTCSLNVFLTLSPPTPPRSCDTSGIPKLIAVLFEFSFRS